MVDVTEHLQLVHWVLTKKFSWAVKEHIEYDDLFQAGYLGLQRAAQKFEPERGFAFSTYAANWVWSFIRRHIQCHHRLVRVPTYAQEKKLMAPERIHYLDELVRQDGATTNHELLGSEDPEFDQVAARIDVERLLKLLPIRYQRVLRLRMRGCTLDEIGLEFGLGRERTRQLELEGVRAIRKQLQYLEAE